VAMRTATFGAHPLFLLPMPDGAAEELARVVLGRGDAMVRNDRIVRRFVRRYHGPIERLELDSEHYVDFTDRQPELVAAVIDWVRAQSARRLA